MNLTPEETEALLNPNATDEQRERALSIFRNRAALQRHRESERVRLASGRGPLPASNALRVQLVADGPVLDAPSIDRADVAALDAWVRDNVPGADKLAPAQVRERSTAIRSALQSVGVKCSRRQPGEPVLLLSAWPGRNETEQLLNMQRTATPALARSPLETQILFTRETRTRFQNRMV